MKYTWAFRLMYIAEILINALFNDVDFRRDSDGDGWGHYERWGGGGHVPPIPSAICVPAFRVLYNLYCENEISFNFVNTLEAKDQFSRAKFHTINFLINFSDNTLNTYILETSIWSACLYLDITRLISRLDITLSPFRVFAHLQYVYRMFPVRRQLDI